LERARREAISDPFKVYEFYDLVEKEVKRLDIKDPRNIWNLDETAFFIDPQNGYVIAATGSQTHRAISGTGKKCFTVMACVNAGGDALPP
ncbi:hypothetical protein, partial [Salmonella enterica]|uniref:hypothetical protein n=1 Tax=Salmonella enterica TaxID=28901 RepID=UPI0039EB7349